MSNIVIADSFKVTRAGYEWNDTMVAPTTVRSGVIAPTLATGFRGNADFQMLNFVNTQADEVQFVVQLPHNMAYNSLLSPHVHFVPTANVADGNYGVEFGLQYFWANINEQFPASPTDYTMRRDFTVASNNHIWRHMIAGNETDITMDKTLSSILVCRLYRNNYGGGVYANYPHPVALLGFDIHYQIDGLGSEQEFTK